MKTWLGLGWAAALVGAGALGWWARGPQSGAGALPGSHAAHAEHGAPSEEGGRRIRFYQSPMHPWIQSDQPGNCTICGMKLVAVYEGDRGFTVDGALTLGSGSPEISGIATTPLGRRPLRRTLRMAGTVDDDDSRHRVLSAYVEGRIDVLHVRAVGMEVQAGEPLADFYSPALLAAVREYVALGESGGLAGADGIRAGAGLRLRQMGLTPAQIEALPRTFTPATLSFPLLAPVSGTVVKRMVYAGQYVKEGEPLFELADFDTMWFQFEAYERDLPWLRRGLPVVVTTPSQPGLSFTQPIVFIDPNLDPMTRSTRVRVELPNPLTGTGELKERRLRHRLYAEGRIDLTTEPLLVIPRSAVMNPDGQAFTWVAVGPSTFERRPLVLGRRGDDAWEVRSGAEAGESVVTAGGFLLDAQSELQRPSSSLSAEPAASGGGTPAGAASAMATPPERVTPAPAAPGTAAGVSTPTDGSVPWPAVEAVTRVALRLGAALAANDVAAFRTAWPAWLAVQRDLAQAGGAKPSAALGAFAQLPADEPTTLAQARARYHAVMEALLPWGAELRRRPGFEGLKSYQCPMTRTSFPGAPPKIRWLQLQAPLRNPWFGPDMLDCGSEVAW
jgi:Cu(I)/Ag(I) efflux system membrane fusion protein